MRTKHYIRLKPVSLGAFLSGAAFMAIVNWGCSSGNIEGPDAGPDAMDEPTALEESDPDGEATSQTDAGDEGSGIDGGFEPDENLANEGSDDQETGPDEACPNNTCNGHCCALDQVCFNENCCSPSCSGKECGSDGCGHDCLPGCTPYQEACNESGTCQCVVSTFKIRFLGTCIPNNYCWNSANRQLSSAMVNEDLLIDLTCWSNAGGAGTCGVARLDQYGIDKEKILFVLITHPHDDHFQASEIVKLAQSRINPTKLTLYSGIETVNALNDYLTQHSLQGLLDIVHLQSRQEQVVGPYLVKPLRASHGLTDVNGIYLQEFYVYVIRFGAAQFLYGLDSGCFSVAPDDTWNLLQQEKLDLIVREGTYAYKSDANCLTQGHMNFAANDLERQTLISHGAITGNTPFWLTHLAPLESNVWPYGCGGGCVPGYPIGGNDMHTAQNGDEVQITTTCP